MSVQRRHERTTKLEQAGPDAPSGKKHTFSSDVQYCRFSPWSKRYVSKVERSSFRWKTAATTAATKEK